jgi:hypothetical protein
MLALTSFSAVVPHATQKKNNKQDSDDGFFHILSKEQREKFPFKQNQAELILFKGNPSDVLLGSVQSGFLAQRDWATSFRRYLAPHLATQ